MVNLVTVRRVCAVVATVALMSLVSCSDDDPEPQSEPTPTVSASPSASPSASEAATPKGLVPPTLPAAAKGSNDKAARAFARYWIDMVNYAQATGDTASLAELHGGGCSACTGGVDAVEETYSAGKSVAGGSYQIVLINSLDSGHSNVRVVAMNTERSAQTILNQRGTKVGSSPAGDTSFKLYLRRDGRRWLVGAAEVLS